MNYVDRSLRREIFGWHSPRLGLDMPIVRYGHFGRALLLLPTASGDFLEAERMWLIKSIEPLLLAGRVTVFSIDSINRHAWMNEQMGVAEAARRQALYSGYIEEEVVPHIRRVLQNPSARIGATGASFGAFYAANAVLRRPDLFDTLIAMSGFYDLGPGYLHGYGDDNVYFNNPTSYLPGLSDPRALELLRNANLYIVSGRGAYEVPDASVRFSQALSSKGIPHQLDLWGHDVNHDWPWWRRMLPYALSERVGW
ncbi:MAG: esterase family protein [Myxococcaceae bacterium]